MTIRAVPRCHRAGRAIVSRCRSLQP
jgi:hypothetical protein